MKQTRKGIAVLSVHRNTRDERQQRDMRKELMADAKEAGKMRAEGKDYIVKDGDVMNFLFNV